jgi:diacylglycerol kinase (ATP)
MTRKIIYLVNPISGVKAKSSLQELIIKKTKERKIDFDIIYTNEAGNYDFLKQQISDEKITDIVICGGDGTVNSVAAALMGTQVNIGIVPSGSGNGLAFAAKIPKQSSKALAIIFNGKASFIDGFYINNKFSCMLCGIGFDALVAHEFAKQKRRGLKTYIKVCAINFFKAKPYKFEVKFNNHSFVTEAFFVSVANGNQFGNHFTIAPKASLDDGLLDVVVVKKMNKLMLLFSVLRQITGINALQNINELSEKKDIIYFQTPSLTIYNNDNAPLHIDGDPRTTEKEFNFHLINNAIKLIQP